MLFEDGRHCAGGDFHASADEHVVATTKHLQARLATVPVAVGSCYRAQQPVVVGAVPAGAVGGGEEMLGSASGIANVAAGEVRAANPDTTHLCGFPLNSRYGGHAFFWHELNPHAGQYGAGVDTSAGGFGATVGGHRIQPQRGGGGEQVGAGGGASEQDSGEGAERLVNFSAQVRVGVRAFEELMKLGGHQRDKPACRAHLLNRLQEHLGAKVHGLNDGAGNDRGGPGEHGAGEHLRAGDIVRGKSQKPLRGGVSVRLKKVLGGCRTGGKGACGQCGAFGGSGRAGGAHHQGNRLRYPYILSPRRIVTQQLLKSTQHGVRVGGPIGAHLYRLRVQGSLLRGGGGREPGYGGVYHG